jgi:phosphoribosyl-ATP pyrophosphohydrolase
VDEGRRALGLAYSSLESLRVAVESRRATYQSRTRGIWTKGATSGNTQELLRVEADCDRDTLRFVVRQHGSGFCHAGTETCWGRAEGLAALERTVRGRVESAPPASYTGRLLKDASLLGAKLVEEARELAEASTAAEVCHEASDLLYFAMVAMARAGIGLADVERELDRRALLVSRTPGDAKTGGLS